MNNCSGGTTPWGTVLSGEENFNQYFRATGTTAGGEALRPLRHPGLAQLALGRPALGRHHRRLPQRAQPLRLGRRDRPDRPHLDPGQAHRDGSLQARGRQRHRQPRRPRRGLHGRRRALRLPLPLRLARHLPPRQQREGPRAQPAPAQRGRPVRRAVHRRRPRGRRQRRHRRVDPAHRRTARRWCPASASRRSWSTRAWPPTRCSPPRWTAPRTSSPACTTAASTSPAPTTPTAARSARRARPSPTRARPTRTATSSRSSPTAATTRAARFTWNLVPRLRRRRVRRHLLRRLDRPGLADLLPRQRRLRQRGQPVGLDRRPAQRDQGQRRPVQGAGRGSRARPRAAVPRRPVRRRDLRPGHPRPRGIGLRRGPAPRRGRHLDRPAVALPRLRAQPAPPRPTGSFAGPRPTVVQVTRA